MPSKLPGGITGKGFLPGQSGNPGGRPKGISIRAHVLAIVAREANAEGKTIAELLAEVGVKHALKGNDKFWRMVGEMVDGKVPERLAGHDGGPLKIDATITAAADDRLDQWRRSKKPATSPPSSSPPAPPTPDSSSTSTV